MGDTSTNFEIDDPGGGARIAGVAGSPGAAADTVLTSDGTGGTSWASGGGSVTSREQLDSNGVSIPPGETAALTWDTKISGDDLLDLTDPAAPVFVASGVYAISGWIDPDSSLTAGDQYNAQLILNEADEAVTWSGSNPSLGAGSAPLLSFAGTYYFAQGTGPVVNVQNNDSVKTIPFYVRATVQRLS